jgi:hypothetical protein
MPRVRGYESTHDAGNSAAPVHAPVHTETLTRAKTVTPRKLAATGSEQLPEQSTAQIADYIRLDPSRRSQANERIMIGPAHRALLTRTRQPRRNMPRYGLG